MDEKQIKLLKMSLSIAEKVIDEVYATMEYCEYLSDDFFWMTKKLSELVGEDLTH